MYERYLRYIIHGRGVFGKNFRFISRNVPAVDPQDS